VKAFVKAHLRTWAWAYLPALLLLAIFLVSKQDTVTLIAQGDERADPASFKTGVLDKDAVATVVGFRDYPILWLGEEFQGYKLTSVARENYSLIRGENAIRVDRVSLVYGSCERAKGESACTPPLAIVIFAPGTMPPTTSGPPSESPASLVRGLHASMAGPFYTLRAGDGVAIQIQSNDNMRSEIVRSLRLANASTIRISEILPGDSLAPLKNVKGP
jgi:hypothetical protein